MEDFEQNDALHRWLLNWCPDSSAYADGPIKLEELPAEYVASFTSAYDGSRQVVHIPRRGTPPPPAHD